MIPPPEPGIRIPRRRTTWESSRGPTSQVNRFTPSDLESRWRTLQLESDTLSKVGAYDLLVLLADLSPEASKALWDFLRFSNPGYTITTTDLGGSPYPEADFEIAMFHERLGALYGSPDVVYNKLFAQAWLRGAFFVELVLDPAGMAVDLCAPDPLTATFQTRADPVRGETFQLGQLQQGKFVPLDALPTVKYAPVDALPGSPYGRAIGAPALFACTFILAVLRDLRMVVQQQGYEHVDLTVVQEVLAQHAPRDVQDDPQKIRAWVDSTLQSVADAYSGMEPDDAYVHTDAITVGRSEGAANANAIGGITDLLGALERMALRALKSMPLLMGITDGVSEANANRQWEIHLAGIKAIQHLLEHVLSGLYGLLLQAAGLQGLVRFEFAEVRGSEAQRDENVHEKRSQNALQDYLYGYVTHEEAGRRAVGHLPAEAAPLYLPRQYVDAQAASNAAEADAASSAPGNPDQPSTGGEDKQDTKRVNGTVDRLMVAALGEG